MPAPSVAILENDFSMYLESVDHQSLRRWSLTQDVIQVQLLPGQHTFVAGPAARAGFVSSVSVEVGFLAVAGHRYRVSSHIVSGSSDPGWEPVLTDMTTGKQVYP